MGIFIILFVLFVLVAFICHRTDDFFEILSSVCAFILFIIIIVNCFDLYTKDQGINAEIVDGGVLHRLLQEDYNPSNLNKALEFNADQKKSIIYNESFLTLCLNKCYSVDTIPIPVTKFIPNTINTIDLNQNFTKDKPVSEK